LHLVPLTIYCGVVDYAEPGKQAPFDISPEDLKMMSNEERIKKGVKEQHERIRKVLSPQALKLMEQEKYNIHYIFVVGVSNALYFYMLQVGDILLKFQLLPVLSYKSNTRCKTFSAKWELVL